ncbi:MAG: hypothetical protein IKY64_06390 [Bacteroidaceae bacterium]|nr:hypothetical protein [Bacteroidaceae bacterium]
MKIKELPDFKRDWNIMFKDNNHDLLEYVIEVANKFHPSFDGIDFSQSTDPMTFNNRYIESRLDLRERYDRMRAMGFLKDYCWETYEKNYADRGILDASFLNKFLDEQLQNTIMAYGLDVSKFWYLLLYVNDYVKDTCVNAFKVGAPLLDELNEMNEKLSDTTEVIFKKDGKKKFSTDRKEVVNILKIAMRHFIHDYNNIVENPDVNIRERLKEIGLDNVIYNSRCLNWNEFVTIDMSYQQYKFAEMMLYFLKDKKGTTPPLIKEKIYKEKNFFVSMLLYVVGLYSEDEETAKTKWYEPYYNDKDNRNLSYLVAKYKNRKFPHSSPKIYWE